jgi:hypothetical protein
METKDPVGWAEHVRAEHHHFRRLIHDLRHAFDVSFVSPTIETNIAAAREKLASFRTELLAHFAHEEEGGYMDEAVARLPSLSHNADKLLAEHASLRTSLDNLLKRLETAHKAATEWDACRAEFARFVEQISLHETNENWLLNQGFNEPEDFSE